MKIVSRFFWVIIAVVVLGVIFVPPYLARSDSDKTPEQPAPPNAQTATFSMGCFWCSQSLFEKFKGVTGTVVGYTGGHTANPSYEDVSTGETGHAESIQITFDPAIITYQQLLDIFWDVHDPTTPDAQGLDVGSQYRSMIFYNSPEQQKLAEASKAAEAKKLGKPVTTGIVPLTTFYRAEEYHQDYFKRNPHNPYCIYEISPKLLKLEVSPPAPLKKS